VTEISGSRSERFAPLLAGIWLSHQPEEFRSAIIRTGRIISCRAHERISYEGDDDRRLFGVIRGAIGCFGSHRHETLILGTVMMPGQWFGFGTIIGHRPRTLGFVALEATELLSFGQPEMRQMGERFPDFPLRVARLQSINFDHAERVVAELLIRNVERRIVAVLLRLAQETRGPPDLPLSQSALAEMANASRASTNKLLGQLERAGLVKAGYGRIVITDVTGLERWFAASAEHSRD
jgi:CRP-like cAMP-binding protein